MVNNSIFNMSPEISPNNDKDFARTFAGAAIRVDGRWRFYSNKEQAITYTGDIQPGNIPSYIVPATKLNKGDFIKDANKYYVVTKVNAGSVRALCLSTDEVKTIVPVKNIQGFSHYSRIITFSDLLNIDGEKLVILTALFEKNNSSNGNNDQLHQLLLFIYLKDMFGTDDTLIDQMLMQPTTAAAINDEQNNGDSDQKNQLSPTTGISNDDRMKITLILSMLDKNAPTSTNGKNCSDK